MQKRLFIKNGIIMTASALAVRSIAMLFRSFLAGSLGAEGMGLYQLIMSVFLVFAAIATSGVTLCATRLFTDFLAVGQSARGRFCIERCLVFALLQGIFLSALLLACSGWAAHQLLHDMRAAAPLKILSPALPLMAVSACIRGYFTARRRTLPPAVGQLLEQAAETGLFAVLLMLLRPSSAEEACCLTVGCCCAAEMLSCGYLYICYRRDLKKNAFGRQHTEGVFQMMLPLLLPVTANACLRSGLSAAENALIPKGLQRYGFSSPQALAHYGIISGMALPLMIFPSVFILPFAVLVIPEMAEAAACRKKRTVCRICEKMIDAALGYSLPAAVIMSFYAEPLCTLWFHNNEAGRCLQILAPVIPFMYLDSVVDGLLKGLNEQTSYFIYNTADSVLRVGLTLLLVPRMGVGGVLAVIIISELVNTLLSLHRLIRLTEFRLSITQSILLPLLTALTICMLLRLLPSQKPLWMLITELSVCILFCVAARRLLRKKPSPGTAAERVNPQGSLTS